MAVSALISPVGNVLDKSKLQVSHEADDSIEAIHQAITLQNKGKINFFRRKVFKGTKTIYCKKLLTKGIPQREGKLHPYTYVGYQQDIITYKFN